MVTTSRSVAKLLSAPPLSRWLRARTARTISPWPIPKRAIFSGFTKIFNSGLR